MSYTDSRDLIEEANTLRELRAAGQTLDEFDTERLAAIDELAEAGIPDWEYGATLIPEDEFTDYARELAEDIGAMPEGNNWPAYCIDREQAANELRMDYTSVTFDGVDYLVRA